MTRKPTDKSIEEVFSLARGLNMSLPRHIHIWLDALGESPEKDELGHPERGKFIREFGEIAAKRFPQSRSKASQIVRFALDELWRRKDQPLDAGNSDPLADFGVIEIGRNPWLLDFATILANAREVHIQTPRLASFVHIPGHVSALARRIANRQKTWFHLSGFPMNDADRSRPRDWKLTEHDLLALRAIRYEIDPNKLERLRGSDSVNWFKITVHREAYRNPSFAVVTENTACVAEIVESEESMVYFRYRPTGNRDCLQAQHLARMHFAMPVELSLDFFLSDMGTGV